MANLNKIVYWNFFSSQGELRILEVTRYTFKFILPNVYYTWKIHKLGRYTFSLCFSPKWLVIDQTKRACKLNTHSRFLARITFGRYDFILYDAQTSIEKVFTGLRKVFRSKPSGSISDFYLFLFSNILLPCCAIHFVFLVFFCVTIPHIRFLSLHYPRRKMNPFYHIICLCEKQRAHN